MKLATDKISAFQFKMSEMELLEVIGTGSYGEVYKARLNTNNRGNRGDIVAVKKLLAGRVLEPEHIEAFCAEASIMM